MVVKVGFVKIGNIGSAPVIELLLDERAEREDIEVRVITTGAKMDVEQAVEITKKMVDYKPDFVVATSPNATLPGPNKIREVLKEAGIPMIVISDSPAKKATKQIEELGQGYMIVEADPMIGARREFLDPIEMALFNADLIKVLSITGVFNILTSEMNKIIDASKRGEKPNLPRMVIDKEMAVSASGLQNPYARVKAMAAYEITRRVADMSVEGCFMVKEWERYTALVAAAHEMLRTAALLADEAREIEKNNDSVLRMPHYDDGTVMQKRKLIEKPRKLGE
ncbi:MAG: F420-dependent methylenetetrahydromethanopterin dehydrogenase [archaeon]|nr:F420-dependent methylenetetrahydromethanopterin dehydrogenase [archaeon]MCP8306038.1 F420-dependent methylenetetrahydromethanopterin dehydrogenase [archaeon]